MERWIIAGLLLLLPVLAESQVVFRSSVISSAYQEARSVTSGDFDGDGDIDVFGAARLSNFRWWEHEGASWTLRVLQPDFTQPTSVSSADMDGDGDLDLLGVSRFDHPCWWENDGEGHFSAHVIISFGYNPDIEGADIDGDNDLDLVVCREATEFDDYGIYWLENIGTGNLNWAVHQIWSLSSASDLDVADIDDDGDEDVAVCGRWNDSVSWYENNNGTWIPHVLEDYSYSHPANVEIADVDGDGALDVVATSDSGIISWWNLLIGTRNDITPTFSRADELESVDLDDDGDLDLIVSFVDAGLVVWFEHDSDSWTEHIIEATPDYASGLDAVDIDLDGDIDILGAFYNIDDILLFTQLGSPGPDPVMLTLTPNVSTIPADGGTLIYEAHLESSIATELQGVLYWTTVITPDQQEVGPLFTQQFTLQPFMDVTVTNLSQTVPGYVDPGEYAFIGHVGYINNPDLQISDDFSFEKLGPGVDGREFDPDDWTGAGWNVASGLMAAELPGEATLLNVYPNPFNAAATLTIQLPEAALVELRLVNLLGQELSLVHHGRMSAGRHQVTIQGLELPSGIYFLTGRAGSETVSFKLMLLK